MLKAFSYAKINIYLHIKGKREDGFHLIDSVFQTIPLKDTLDFAFSSEFHLECAGENIPCDERNLVWKAYEAFKEIASIGGVRIFLRKEIPSGRGLGGGSSNAAVTLIALNKLWGYPVSMGELFKLASLLGADVPFFLKRGRAKIWGIGDEIEKLPDVNGYLVLLDPGVEAETEKVYRKYDELLNEGFDFSSYKNHLLPPALFLYPELRPFAKMGMDMTGSGSCFFSIFKERSEAKAFYDKIHGWRKWIFQFLPSHEYKIFADGE